MAGGKPVLTYTSREPLALWRAAVRDACAEQMHGRGPFEGPIMLQLDIAFARPRGHFARNGDVLPRFAEVWPASRPDADKLARAVLDALTMTLYRDDAQVVMLDIVKRYCGPDEAEAMTLYAARPARGVLL
jgi:Holliday junction resolvase RusA-like endonuclease